MMNITHEQTRPQASDTYAGQILNSAKRNFGRCLAVMKTGPQKAIKRSELTLILCLPVLAMSTAILPAVTPMPAMRLICASVLAGMLALFVGRQLVIVQSMSQDHTYKLTSALMGTFLLGLVVAIMSVELFGMLTH